MITQRNERTEDTVGLCAITVWWLLSTDFCLKVQNVNWVEFHGIICYTDCHSDKL